MIYAPIAAQNGIDSKQGLRRLRATLDISALYDAQWIQLDLPFPKTILAFQK